MIPHRIRLKVAGISYSQIHSGAYALILAQAGGEYRIPVVIGPAEAQSIAMIMERVTPPRPLTHDLFVNFARSYGIKVSEINIYKFEDGIYYSEITFTDGDREVKIDSRTSDAIALALRTGAPIFTTREVLNETGFLIEKDESEDSDSDSSDEPFDSNPEPESPKLENLSISELEKTMQRLIAEENYEEAARVNQILKRKRDNL